jgi:Cdc6-like AAA superfamily ATPase
MAQQRPRQISKDDRELELTRVFTPATPVSQRDLFAGRVDQLRRVLEAVQQRGQHGVIFGERGVGKTSLANILRPVLQANARTDLLCVKVNCDVADDFSSVWKKVFGEIPVVIRERGTGFVRSHRDTITTAATLQTGDRVNPIEVTRLFRLATKQDREFVIVIDEFDRLDRQRGTALFADTVKAFADEDVSATLIIVGVADTVDDLIREHASVERSLVQIRMPRMSPSELSQIVSKGLRRAHMSIRPAALERIVALSQGLPNYTHELALNAARSANDDVRSEVDTRDVGQAILRAVDRTQESMLNAYIKATSSHRNENLYKQVLLSCALARTDIRGSFAASDVRQPMRTIMGRPYDIPAFSRHLNDFCESDRGPVLHKDGTARRFRFRFVNPLMQPHVIMRGIADGLITADRAVLPP